MNLLKTQPVALFTAAGTLLLTVLTVLLAAGILPAPEAAWASAVIAVLNAALGGKVWKIVTPLARPRDAVGNPLAPGTKP